MTRRDVVSAVLGVPAVLLGPDVVAEARERERREARNARRRERRRASRPADSTAPVPAPALPVAVARPVDDGLVWCGRCRARVSPGVWALHNVGVPVSGRVRSTRDDGDGDERGWSSGFDVARWGDW